MTQVKITDSSNDKEYFVLTPQIVWAISRDPYDYTLWNVIKMIAGDSGECFLSTDDLAALSMMSSGKVSECRKYLISQELLEGEIRQDPGYPQPVWHLTIPDLWKANLEWREQNTSLKKRIEFKRKQRDSLKDTRKKAKHNSLHQAKPSPDEGGLPPDEGGLPPDETKNNQLEKPESITNEPNGAKSNLNPQEQDELLVFGIYGQNGNPPEPESLEEEVINSGWPIKSNLIEQALVAFLRACRESGLNLKIPNSDRMRKDWLKSLSDHTKDYDIETLESRYKQAIHKAKEGNWFGNIGRPGSLDKTLPTIGNTVTNGKATQNEDGSYYL